MDGGRPKTLPVPLTEALLVLVANDAPEDLVKRVTRLLDEGLFREVAGSRGGRRFHVAEWMADASTHFENVVTMKAPEPGEPRRLRLPPDQLKVLAATFPEFMDVTVLQSSLPRLARDGEPAVAVYMYNNRRFREPGVPLYPHQVTAVGERDVEEPALIEQRSMHRYRMFHDAVATMHQDISRGTTNPANTYGWCTTGVADIITKKMAINWLRCGENRYVISAVSGVDCTEAAFDERFSDRPPPILVDLIKFVAANDELASNRPITREAMSRIQRLNHLLVGSPGHHRGAGH